MTEQTLPVVIAERPRPGTPRPYQFPEFTRTTLSNGLGLIVVDLPGRPLVSATLVIVNGAADEPAATGGATVLAARALTEGTERHDAIGLVEAAERLGASLHAEAGWDATSIGVDVAADRLAAALELVAEVAAQPTFPAPDVERLRDERLNDLLQAKADPRRRAEEAFAAALYGVESPYHRPTGGTRETVAGLDREALRAAYLRGVDPARMSLIVGGELGAVDVPAIAERLFGSLRRSPEAMDGGAIDARPAATNRRIRVVHRPDSVQTEMRIGHPGLPRRIPDFHAVSVMAAILGGLFNSRLNMKLREEKGYTYGAGAGFDLRRGAGPFSARAAVNTAATVPAVVDTLAELERIRDEPVSDGELAAARDFLVGVFPLRFETPGPIVASLGGMVVHGLPDDELARYRQAIEAVTVDDIQAAARAHIHPDELAIVLVGDADAFVDDLEQAGLGPIEVERDTPPVSRGPLEGVEDELGPVDADEVGRDRSPDPDATEPPSSPGSGPEEAAAPRGTE